MPDNFPAMSSAAVEQAALADPDSKPLTERDFARMKQTPRARIIRRALDLTQEDRQEPTS